MSNLVVICPECGRKMPSYRNDPKYGGVCFRCSGVEVREAQYFVDQAKEFAPEHNPLVSQERVEEIAASLEHLADILPGNHWYMRASYKMHADIEPVNKECDHCCSPEFCKNCFGYEQFNWHSSCNKDTDLMTGCTVEDVGLWYTAPVSDRWFPLNDKNGNPIEENVAKMDQVTGKFNDHNMDDIVRRECASENSAYARSLEGEDTWFRMQRLIEEDALGLADEYSLKLALKKSTSMVGYSVETIIPPTEGLYNRIHYGPRTLIEYSNPATIDIHSLALTADEAVGRSGTKNHARRIRVSAGFVELKHVKVSKNDEPIDIIRKLEKEQFGELEEYYYFSTP